MDALGARILYGADWTGKSVLQFTLDGNDGNGTADIVALQPPEGVHLYELTSVRRGKGLEFDPSSLYITEGGGVLPSQTNRRVLQLKLN
jgi:hypothetical protein